MKRFFIILLVFNFSCQIIDRPEKAPSFIQIDDFQFSISNNNQGTSSEKITDAWIYLNGNLEGAYELPATIPLHYEGIQELSITPELKEMEYLQTEKNTLSTPNLILLLI